jgi:gamma-glutamyltranspeptidase
MSDNPGFCLVASWAEGGVALEAMEHELRSPDGVAFGGGQAILKLTRGWATASDPRKDGVAAGN